MSAMSITFVAGKSKSETNPQHYVLLESELHDYLTSVSREPGVSLPAIVGLDPYGDAVFSDQQLLRLKQQLEAALPKLQALFQQAALPAYLEPPAVVGLETDDEGTPCGRDGVLRFFTALNDLCREAQEQELAVFAFGD